MKFVDEFKDFISRGNVVDMAVGVVVGGAFKSIVDSLVADIINPGIAYVVSLITGALKTAATSTVGDTSAVESVMDMSKWIIPGTSINIGNFLSAIINFLILAFIIFCFVKRQRIIQNPIERNSIGFSFIFLFALPLHTASYFHSTHIHLYCHIPYHSNQPPPSYYVCQVSQSF